MAQKNETPSTSQQESIRRIGLDPLYWVVVRDLHYSMIIRHRQTGEMRVINK